MKTITIQPESPKDDPLKLPYPYHIDQAGRVGRQEFWKGEPESLVGFSTSPNPKIIGEEITMRQFLAKPERCIGMYPIFRHKGDKWFTYKNKIASVREN